MHGEDTFYWPDGRKYKGECRNLKAACIFSLYPLIILNRDFCMVQIDCQIRQMKNSVDGCFSVRVCEKLLTKLYEEMD